MIAQSMLPLWSKYRYLLALDTQRPLRPALRQHSEAAAVTCHVHAPSTAAVCCEHPASTAILRLMGKNSSWIEGMLMWSQARSTWLTATSAAAATAAAAMAAMRPANSTRQGDRLKCTTTNPAWHATLPTCFSVVASAHPREHAASPAAGWCCQPACCVQSSGARQLIITHTMPALCCSRHAKVALA